MSSSSPPHSWISQPTPLLVVLSGPSGAGKDSILRRLKELRPSLYRVVTATTRPRRQDERDGIDYHFLSPERFEGMIAEGEFLEHARVYNHWYGVPKAQVRDALNKGQDVALRTDVQGAATIRKVAPQGVFILIAPPSQEELEKRLRERKTESAADLALRLRIAEEEMKQLSLFDYLVVNHRDKIEEAVEQIQAILEAERCRIPPRAVKL